MNRLIIIAGLSAFLGAGAFGVAAAQAQAPAQPPAAQPAAPPPAPPGVGMPGKHVGPGMRPGHGMRGRGGMRGGRMGLNGPLTPQERQARVAAMFAQLDANRDGRATFAEFQAFQERQRTERQRRAFNNLSGGQDSVTLDQLTTRLNERGQRGPGPGGPGGGGRGR